MTKIKVTQIRSIIGTAERQKRTMIALGLKKMNRTVVHEVTPQIIGMLKKIAHLVKIQNS